jgi:phosphopantothenoylcysteine synthetase/decarboxylase
LDDLHALYTSRFLGYNDEWIGSNSINDQEEILRLKNNPVIWEQVGDPILHIQLRQWADIALVAPLSAHTLAKLSNGLCDDLLSCTLRAWDFSTQAGIETTTSSCHRAIKPILLAPAMNTAMWDHPITKKQLEYICSLGSEQLLTKNEPNVNKDDDGVVPSSQTTHSNVVRVIPPQVKKLACGDHGNGALADLSDILTITKEYLCNSGFHNYFFKDV